MRIAMLCHAGHATGTGHLVRCVSLAAEATRRGHQTVIVGRFDDSTFLRSLLEGAGPVVRLSSADPHEADAAIGAVGPDLVHVDTYGDVVLTGEWLVSNMRDGRYGARPADLVIDPTIGAETPGPSDAGSCTELLGADFAPLREEVATRHGAWFDRGLRRVLVTMGSTDPHGLTPEIVRGIMDSGLGAEVTVLSRRGGPDVPEAPGVRWQPSTPDFAGLALQHDLVVSAAGTTVSELACLGVPMALVCAVPNQRPAYERLVSFGAAWGLGAGPDHESRATRLRTLAEHPGGRAALSRAALDLVDGRGAERIVRAWEELQGAGPLHVSGDTTIRPAIMADAPLLLRWRIDPDTRRVSRSRGPVAESEHRKWLEQSLGRSDRLIFVAERNGIPVGTVRWDLGAEGTWEVSITVAPEARGGGTGTMLLRLGESALASSTEPPVTVQASVHQDNQRSVKLFTGAGYVRVQDADERGFLGFEKVVR